MGDRLSQHALETQVADAAMVRFPEVTEGAIWSEILLWSGMNKHKFLDPEKQMEAMWDAVQVACEKLKADISGYSIDDLYFYSLPHLKELVTQVCAGINGTRLDEGYADVSKALYRLVDTSSRATIIGVNAGWLEEDDSYASALVALQATLGGRKPKGLK